MKYPEKRYVQSAFLSAKIPRSGAWSKMPSAFLGAQMASVFLAK